MYQLLLLLLIIIIIIIIIINSPRVSLGGLLTEESADSGYETAWNFVLREKGTGSKAGLGNLAALFCFLLFVWHLTCPVESACLLSVIDFK